MAHLLLEFLPGNYSKENGMIKGLYNAAAGMIPRESQLDAVANNLANANTTGFKADRRLFRTLLNNILLQGGPRGDPINLPDEDYYLHTDFSQGSLIQTHNPLDLAIAGQGFFTIETAAGESFSRDGNFKLNDAGELIDNLGNRVMGETGPIVIIGNEVVVKGTGEVVVDGGVIDKLMITDFNKPYNLHRNGYGYFVPTEDQQGSPAKDFRVEQGQLEESNVNIVQVMVQMLQLNRAYESLQKSIHAQDETLRMATNEIAKV